MSVALSSIYFKTINQIFRQTGIAVLMYHRVNDQLAPGELNVSTNKFHQQMDYLKSECDVLSLAQFQQALSPINKGMTTRKPRVLLTFDDGYLDTYTHAYPILKEFQLPAVVFLATGLIGTDQCLGRYQTMPKPDMMNWQQAAQMASDNITFAAHSVSHPDLSKLSVTEQRFEITASIDHIFTHFKHVFAKSVFCFPYGAYTTETLQILRDRGIKMAFTVNPGFNSPTNDHLQIKRFCVDGRMNQFQFMKLFNFSPRYAVYWRMNQITDQFRKILPK